MLKLVIVLCAVLFALAADDPVWESTLNSFQLNTKEVLSSSILELNRKNEDNGKSISQITRNLSDAAIEAKKNLNKTSLVEFQLGSEISNLIGNVKDVNVSDCFEYLDRLKNTTKNVLLNVGVCIDDRLIMGIDYIVSIKILFENEFDRLAAIDKQIKNCLNDIYNMKSAIAAILCTKEFGNEAINISPAFIETLNDEMRALNFFVSVFQASLDNCSTAYGIDTFHQESSTVVEKTNNCIQQKIDEAPTTTTKNNYSSEVVHA